MNHQYSKSAAFERLLQAELARSVAPDLAWFSLLRPLGELRIAQLFAAETRYDPVFSSCNRNFRLEGAGPPGRWCRDCPKCRFVALVLAPFMKRTRLEAILGGNPLDDPAQIAGYRELVGLAGHKPWECVGEIEEAAAAMLKLADRNEWRGAAVPAALGPSLAPRRGELEDAFARAMAPAAMDTLPPRYAGLLARAPGDG